MKSRLVRIGNSRGIRLSKPVIEQARLAEEVEVDVRDRKSTRLNSSHVSESRMPSSA